VAKVDALKNGHLRCILVDPTGGSIKAMAWRAEGGKLGTRLLARAGPLHLAGRLRADDWNGRRGVQLEIEDAADPRQRAA
jgi:single-stranded-DNA-specific exonuclease